MLHWDPVILFSYVRFLLTYLDVLRPRSSSTRQSDVKKMEIDITSWRHRYILQKDKTIYILFTVSITLAFSHSRGWILQVIYSFYSELWICECCAFVEAETIFPFTATMFFCSLGISTTLIILINIVDQSNSCPFDPQLRQQEQRVNSNV